MEQMPIFDFHQLQDNDHCKSNIDCIVYDTEGGTSFNTQDGFLLPKLKHISMVCMDML